MLHITVQQRLFRALWAFIDVNSRLQDLSFPHSHATGHEQFRRGERKGPLQVSELTNDPCLKVPCRWLERSGMKS